jgi:metal-responsive CopG/Arc/MetJ family transcriptional regulator
MEGIKYNTIKVPLELLKNVEKFIEENKQLGYRSKNEFCISAIRKLINSK